MPSCEKCWVESFTPFGNRPRLTHEVVDGKVVPR